MGLWRTPPRQIMREIQNGTRTSTYSRQTAIHKLSELSGPAIPNALAVPGEKNTRIAAMNTSAWATWMASTPVNARHHSLARPSVCGNAWHTSASGAAPISKIVSMIRTT